MGDARCAATRGDAVKPRSDAVVAVDVVMLRVQRIFRVFSKMMEYRLLVLNSHLVATHLNSKRMVPDYPKLQRQKSHCNCDTCK